LRHFPALLLISIADFSTIEIHVFHCHILVRGQFFIEHNYVNKLDDVLFYNKKGYQLRIALQYKNVLSRSRDDSRPEVCLYILQILLLLEPRKGESCDVKVIRVIAIRHNKRISLIHVTSINQAA
jgi:hypothetical protein